jgi:probable F420-dependent oxidoreductase
MPLRPFRFGVINESFSTAAAWRGQAKKAEAIGCSTFLIRDHLVPDHFGAQFAPFTALAMAAAATTSLHVGSYMIDNDFRHPAVLAKECATLDLLSDGRFELGLGAGWLTSEYHRAGIPFDPAGVRLSRMEESINVLKTLFAGEEATFKGAHYDLNALSNFPTPATGRVPLVIGGGKKRVLQIAGREADVVGVMTSTLTTTFSSTADPEGRRAAGV